MRKEKFFVNQRSVRDGFTKLEKLHKRKMAKEEKASGIGPEITEIDEALENIVERTKEVQEQFAVANEGKEKKRKRRKQ